MTALVDSAARERIRRDLDTTLIVEAAAGTGKTTELVARVLALLTSGRARLSGIVAVTFTEKAAGEMKLRLRGEIEKARASEKTTAEERARLEAALAELEAAHISTIHGFCADLLRERPVEAAVDPLFEMAADEESDALVDEAFHGWFEAILGDPPEGVRRVLRRPSRDRDAWGPQKSLRNAGAELVKQRDFDGPWRREPFDRAKLLDEAVEKIALAGSYASRAFKPDDYLAKNLDQLQRFVDELARRESIAAEAGGPGRDYDGLEAELRVLAGGRTKWKWRGGGSLYGRGLARADVVKVRDEAKAGLDAALARCDADLAACLREELRPFVAAYEELKTRAGKLDFLDLLVRARDLLRDDRAVRRDLQQRFSHLLVDEFQDTDPLQAEILLYLAADDPDEDDARRATPVPGKLFLVGDPKQSIYRFRRADVALYETVKRRLVAKGAEVLHLSTSFRSAPAIQRVVNAAFAPVMNGGEDGSQAEYVALQPFRADPAGRPSVVVLPVPSPYTEYGKIQKWQIEKTLPDAVGAFVDFLVSKSGWTVTERDAPEVPVPIEARHVCLLFKRFQSFGEDVTRPYVRALEARGIPHVLVGGRSYHAREEVTALRNALFAIEWPDDDLSVYATLRGPFFALGDDALLAYRAHAKGPLHPMRPVDAAKLSPAAREVQEALDVLRSLHTGRNRRPIADTIGRLFAATRAHAGIAIWPGGEQALANLLRMTDLARRFESAGATSFRAFVDHVGEDADRRNASEAPVVEEGVGGVRMMTVHKSKGLEFPVVILVDPTAPPVNEKPTRWVEPEGRVWAMPLAGAAPIELLEHEDEVKKRDRDEAMRLVYVAATRARELLVVPGIGDPMDEPLDGWVDVLEPALRPSPRERRSPRPAPGCPRFGADTVVERPATSRSGPESAVAPGLHAASAGGHDVVWWDPSTLDLGKEHEAGLRQEKLLAADDTNAIADEGVRTHAAWVESRASLLAKGAEPTLRVEIATERAKTRGGADGIARERVATRRADRPRGNRFGSLVHATLAELPLDADDARIGAVAEKQARLVAATRTEIDAAVVACREALAHPLLRRAARAETEGNLRREVPVSYVDESGVLLEGVVDLAFREQDGGGVVWTVVDYKTDAGELPAAYDAQVAAYVAAIEKATGESARGVLLAV